MKKTVLMLSFAASLMGMASSAQADLIGFLDSVNRQAVGDIKSFNDRLSRQFGVPVPDVEAILRSVPSPADAFMILHLGHIAHLAPAVVLQRYQRNKGKGWGALAGELGIKPGSPEFHALKRGDLSFTGVPGGPAAQRKGGGRAEHKGGGPGQGAQGGQGSGRGKGQQKD
jgi:hypothetical protein